MNTSAYYCPHCYCMMRLPAQLYCDNCKKYIPGNRTIKREDSYSGISSTTIGTTSTTLCKLPIEYSVPKNNKLKLLL